MSFLEKIKSSRSELLYLVRGKDKGRECWHYILVDKQKLPMFKVKVKTDFIDLDEYGQVLHSGWGKNPPDELAEQVKAEYS